MRSRLSYAGKFIPELVQQSNEDNDCIAIENSFTFPDQTTKQTLIAQWSQEEFTEIFSAVLAGAMLISPDTYINTVDTFSRIIFCMPDLCELIAACIDNDESATALSLQQFLARNGYSRDFDNVDNAYPVLNSTQTGENLLSGVPCTEPHLMAISRGLVRELNESTEDLLEIIEIITNPVELTEIVADQIPVAGMSIAFVAWIQDTLAETYTASYTQAVEDEIACALFCEAIDDCDLSLDDMIAVYQSLMDEIVPPDNVNDVVSLLEWAAGLGLTVTTATVAAFHYLLLQLLRFGAGIEGFEGMTSLKSTILSLASEQDFSYTECDCAPSETPTDYWMIRQNFSLGLGSWQLQQGSQQSGGILSNFNTGGVNQLVLAINDLGATFECKAAGTITQRRGSTGNGGGDVDRIRAFPSINTGGTPQDICYNAFILCNTNNCGSQEEVFGGGTQPAQSIQVYCRDNGNYSAGTNFVLLREIVVYGLCNTGQVKPPQAVYVNSIPAAGNLFD